jgi:hypothetical protein
MDYASAAYHRAKEEMRRRDIEKYGQDVYDLYLREVEVHERDVINTRNCRASLHWEGSSTEVPPLLTLDQFAERMGRKPL